MYILHVYLILELFVVGICKTGDVMSSEFSILSSLFAIFLAEIGDKTMLSTLLFAINTKRYVLVLTTSTLAFILANVVVIVAGSLIRGIISLNILHLLGALLLIVVGLWTLLSREELNVNLNTRLNVVACFISIFLMEIGDKTQLAFFSLTLLYTNLIYILIGSVLGYVLVNTLGVLVTKIISSRVDWRRVRKISALIMIIIGICLVLV